MNSNQFYLPVVAVRNVTLNEEKQESWNCGTVELWNSAFMHGADEENACRRQNGMAAIGFGFPTLRSLTAAYQFMLCHNL